MSTPQELVVQIQDKARVAAIIEKRYRAHFELHGAAVLNRDSGEMTQRRDELHTILDALLDNAEALQRLNDELAEITNRHR